MTLGIGFCSIELGAGKGKPPTRFLLLKDGDIGWSNLKGVKLDAEQAANIIEAFVTHGVDLVIDYEHATPAIDSGKRDKAPAAGWIKGLVYVKGEGLYADPVEWTEGAIDEIEKREYKYSSPVIVYDEDTLKIKRLHSVALTNKPRTIGQAELLAAARAIVDFNKENDVAHSLSAKKRIRQNAKKRLLNRARNSAVKTQIKKFYSIAQPGSDIEQAETEMRLAQKKINQLAAHRIIHKKNASRKIARMARAFNAVKTKAG